VCLLLAVLIVPEGGAANTSLSVIIYRHFNKQDVLGISNRLLSFDTTGTAFKTTKPTTFLSLRVYSLPG
jgi:hypothetical protein